MAGIEFELDQRAVSRYQKGLEGYEGRAKNLRKPFREFGGYLLEGIDSQFASASGWPALKPSTIRQRQSEGYGAGPILVRSGKLKKGFGQRPTAQTLTLINTRKSEKGKYIYHYHQNGRGNNPKREMLIVNQTTKSEYQNIIGRWLYGTV